MPKNVVLQLIILLIARYPYVQKIVSVSLLKMWKTLFLLLRLNKNTVSKKLPLLETESFHSKT